jgi:hypothetical protein
VTNVLAHYITGYFKMADHFIVKIWYLKIFLRSFYGLGWLIIIVQTISTKTYSVKLARFFKPDFILASMQNGVTYCCLAVNDVAHAAFD